MFNEVMLSYFFGYIMFLMSLILMWKYYDHVLMVLVCIEFIVIINLFNIYMMLMQLNSEFYLLIFMVMFVMEGILGISIVVMIIRFKGNEYLSKLNLLW
uniref:NADH dehydrogenase subunit 4L n=2 Tax=Vespa simillima TaxID=445438 RepID=A0A6B9WF78_9HYME|nr:NADH dehydrogenase subunit 4L [Vespa simillima simillima]QHQ97689.1 NADH dehydrogenase subunit 4L [Vespa simillima simillima]